MSCRGTSSQCLHPSPGEHVVTKQGVLSPSRPEMDHGCPGLLDGVGHQYCKARRDGKRLKARDIRWSELRRGSKTKALAKEKGQVERERCKSKQAGPGGGMRLPSSTGCMDTPDVGPESNPLRLSISLGKWIACLPRWILKTRTKLAFCLRRSFAVVRRSLETSSTVFSLPLASLDCFLSSGPGLSHRRWTSVCHSRLINMWILVLDFLYLSRWPTCDELRRTPTAKQLKVFDHLRRSITVCGAVLVFQLEQSCETCPAFASGYMQRGREPFREDPNLLNRDEFPELTPYRSLCADRLRI